MICVFEGCSDSADAYGACEKHVVMARAVMRGESPRCIHNVTLAEACAECGAQRIQQSMIYDILTRSSVALISLVAQLRDAGLTANLHAMGGLNAALYDGATINGEDGRVYRITWNALADSDGGVFHVKWGTDWVISASSERAIVLYFIGLRARVESRRG